MASKTLFGLFFYYLCKPWIQGISVSFLSYQELIPWKRNIQDTIRPTSFKHLFKIHYCETKKRMPASFEDAGRFELGRASAQKRVHRLGYWSANNHFPPYMGREHVLLSCMQTRASIFQYGCNPLRTQSRRIPNHRFGFLFVKQGSKQGLYRLCRSCH